VFLHFRAKGLPQFVHPAFDLPVLFWVVFSTLPPLKWVAVVVPLCVVWNDIIINIIITIKLWRSFYWGLIFLIFTSFGMCSEFHDTLLNWIQQVQITHQPLQKILHLHE
jgi:hypothetical protein